MPVILQDAAVVNQGFCAPISSPAVGPQAPFDIGSLNPGVIASAVVVPAAQASSVAAPIVVNPQAGSDVAAPIVTPAVSASVVDAPNVVINVSGSSVTVPIVVPFVAATALDAPNITPAVSATDIAAPISIGGQSASVIAAPNVAPAVAATDVAAPNVTPAVSAASMAAPNVVAPNAYSDQPPFPLNHPRILYQSKLAGSSSAGSGTNRIGLLNPSTWDRWTFTAAPASTITAEFTLPANQSVDTIAIAAHNLGTISSNVRFDYATTVGGAWVQFAAGVVPTSNNAILVTMPTAVSAAKVRIVIFGGTGSGYIGVLYAGIALQMQHAIYGGVNPITLNRVTDYFSNKSEAGEWLGRQVRRRGLESSLSFNRLTAPWYRQYFDPFVKSAITTPFFFAWRPSDYPLEVAYCWTESDIQPSNSGGATNHMAVQFAVKAHA